MSGESIECPLCVTTSLFYKVMHFSNGKWFERIVCRKCRSLLSDKEKDYVHTTGSQKA